jgi:transcriptional regulator with XRE-family HTH domain
MHNNIQEGIYIDMFAARRIRDRRKALGISQEALAVMIGTNQGQVSKFENGESVPSSDILAALAHALKTSSDWLLGLADDHRPELHEYDLTPKEREAVTAWRRGERLKAIRVIVLDE